jgi:SAM-dependent methyltransferase
MPLTPLVRSAGKRLLSQVNRPLRRVGFEFTRYIPRRELTEYRDFIPFGPTLAAAVAAGMPVGDYIDATHNRPGVTAETIDQLAGMEVLHPRLRRICEIGPGSGRYLEKTIAVCRPDYCEIYETAEEWRDYLVKRLGVVAQPTDGSTLARTPDASVDLVQAHKVFPGLSFLVSCCYFAEMARVVSPGGSVVFDIVTEECMDEETLQNWRKAKAGYQLYPSLMPRAYALDFFARQGLTLRGSFIAPMMPGKTECLAFTKPTA